MELEKGEVLIEEALQKLRNPDGDGVNNGVNGVNNNGSTGKAGKRNSKATNKKGVTTPAANQSPGPNPFGQPNPYLRTSAYGTYNANPYAGNAAGPTTPLLNPAA